MKNMFDDSNSFIFNPRRLGKTNFASGWTMSNIFRYMSMCDVICNTKKTDVKLLDVGCSVATFFGFYQSSFVQKNKPNLCYTGVEYLQKSVDDAKTLFGERADKYTNPFNIIKQNIISELLPDHGNLKNQNKDNGKYDIIILAEIIEHVGENCTRELLRQSKSLLNHNGIIVISTPSPRREEGVEFVWPENHIREFSLSELLELCSEEGVSPIQQYGWLGMDERIMRKGTKSQIKLYKRLQSISKGYAKATIAHLYPELAECVTLILNIDI